MAYIDKNGALRNSKEDLEAFTAYTRSRVRLMKHSDSFLEYAIPKSEEEWDKVFPPSPPRRPYWIKSKTA